MSSDPSVISSLAISAEDLLAAAEASARDERRTVLRVTPPYSGRMRARIHVPRGSEAEETVHLDPWTIVGADAPEFPTADETEDELRAASDADYSVERHREYHETRVSAWREALLDHVRDSITLPGSGQTVRISVLGP